LIFVPDPCKNLWSLIQSFLLVRLCRPLGTLQGTGADEVVVVLHVVVVLVDLITEGGMDMAMLGGAGAGAGARLIVFLR
jgi:hypothetical protein